MPLIGNVFKPLAKSVLIPLGLTAAASAADAAIQTKFLDLVLPFWNLINSSEEIEDIMKIVKSREDSGLWTKGAAETITNEAKE